MDETWEQLKQADAEAAEEEQLRAVLKRLVKKFAAEKTRPVEWGRSDEEERGQH